MSARTAKITQRQADIAVVQGWIAAAQSARETPMVEFYERILSALKQSEAGSPRERPA